MKINELFKAGNYVFYITVENSATKTNSIRDKKNEKLRSLWIYGNKSISNLGHITASDFTNDKFYLSFTGKEVFANLSNEDYSKLKDKMLTIQYKLPQFKFVDAQVYRIDN